MRKIVGGRMCPLCIRFRSFSQLKSSWQTFFQVLFDRWPIRCFDVFLLSGNVSRRAAPGLMSPPVERGLCLRLEKMSAPKFLRKKILTTLWQ
jgi:hypothetical protein